MHKSRQSLLPVKFPCEGDQNQSAVALNWVPGFQIDMGQAFEIGVPSGND